MGVLPDRSKKIVPQAFWDLMSNPDSPIIDFYPRDFDLDMNGKKQDWEAVVKIPFIDEDRLLKAMKTKQSLLTPDEVNRNEYGVSLKFTYSNEVDYTYPSPLVGIFPDIPHCHSVANVFDLPTMDGLDLHVGLVDGVKLGDAALAGFPSLKTLKFTAGLAHHGVNVFQRDSSNESMVVTLTTSKETTSIEYAKERLGRVVHIGYPFLQEARISKVSDELHEYTLREKEVSQSAHGMHEIEAWRKKAHSIQNQYSKRFGMVIGTVESLIHVEVLKGLQKTDDGASVKEYGLVSGVETDYAFQAMVHSVISEDQRFLEKSAVPIQEEFPEGTQGFFLGEFSYGRPAEVTGHAGNTLDMWVSVVKVRDTEFGKEIARNAERSSPYTPSYAVARNLRLNPLVLSKLTSSMSVMLGEQRINLGLNLKFEAKKLKVLGYSRRGATGWEFSDKAVDLIKQYMIAFPHFIAGIQRNPQGDIYRANEFYPAEEASTHIKEIQTWLKAIDSRNLEKVPLDAEQLDSNVVQMIEAAADNLPKGQPEGKKIRGVPRKALLKPSDCEHRLGNQLFSLGDRLIYVQDSGRVPIGTRGTVVGLIRTSRALLLDVVFDISFMSGTSLGERCSPFRGSTVPITSVLNLSNRQLIAGSKASQNKQAQSNPQSHLGGYGAPSGHASVPQFVDARAPAPLAGGWNRAAGTKTNGAHQNSTPPSASGQALPSRQKLDSTSQPANRGSARARGRGGITRTSQPHQTNGVGDTPGKQAYNNVPPPATLNARGRGRGRGSVRGSASRGRGQARGGANTTPAAQVQT
jgi:5'-3' exoribonuclease 1